MSMAKIAYEATLLLKETPEDKQLNILQDFLEETTVEKHGEFEWQIIENYANEIIKLSGSYSSLDYDMLKYKLRLVYREAESVTLRHTDRNYHNNIIPKIIEILHNAVIINIMGLEDILDHIEGNENKIQDIDIERLGYIIQNLKFLVRNNGQEQR